MFFTEPTWKCSRRVLIQDLTFSGFLPSGAESTMQAFRGIKRYWDSSGADPRSINLLKIDANIDFA
jgi:hypothetical protein